MNPNYPNNQYGQSSYPGQYPPQNNMNMNYNQRSSFNQPPFPGQGMYNPNFQRQGTMGGYGQPNYGMPPSQPNYGMPPNQPNYGMPPNQPNYGMPPNQQQYGMNNQHGYMPNGMGSGIQNTMNPSQIGGMHFFLKQIIGDQ